MTNLERQPPPTLMTAPSQESDAVSAPKCEQCGGTGEFRYMVLVGSGPDQRLENRTGICGKCEAGKLAGKKVTERARWAVWNRSGIPSRFLVMSLETSPWSEARPEMIKEIRTEAESVLLWGSFGVGKTGLAVSIARTWVWPEDGDDYYDPDPFTVIFKTLPDLMSELRDTYNRREGSKSEQQVIDECRGANLLILDDLGAEQVKDSGWFEDRLYQIIGHRHADRAPTIFTSNLSPQQLGARIGERNMWRIVEMCGEHVYHLDGPNLRAS